MLDVHRLRVFRSVVATGSVQAAAASLGYTPSAVSQHITALQRETGLVLFERAGRGIRVTANGHALASAADDILERVGTVESLVADLRAGRVGSLSISYFASIGSSWLPRVVERLTREFPELRLDLRLADEPPADPAEWADITLLVAREGNQQPRGFQSEHLHDDPYVVALPGNHPLARCEAVPLTGLADEHWIDNDFSRGWCRRNLLDACAAAGFSPPFRVEAHDYPAALAFVATGIGITVLPTIGAVNAPGGIVVRPIAPPTPVRSIHAIVRESALPSPAAQVALDELKSAALVSAAHGRASSAVTLRATAQ